MQKSLMKRILLNTFWLSLLLHLLALLIFTILVYQPQQKQKTPEHYVSSYFYTAPKTPTIQQSPSNETASLAQQQPVSQPPKMPELPPTKEAETPKVDHTKEVVRVPSHKKRDVTAAQSILAAGQELLRENQRRAIHTMMNAQEPIYLVGEDNVVSDPLIKLIGRALSAHFEYPQMAGEMGITGRVVIGLTLHPEGHFSDVLMLKSSNNPDLDAAALYAVNQAPQVIGADRFLSEPKYFVVGFIFR
jgi:TonB family protein